MALLNKLKQIFINKFSIKVKIILIRHAESEGNSNPYLYLKKSDSDIELTEKGVEQSFNINLNGLIHYPLSTVIFSSPYKRALYTAINCVNSNSSLRGKSIIENPLLVERNWGDLRIKIFNKEHSDSDFKFFNQPENGESFFGLYQRVITFLNYLKLNYNDSDEFIIFTHGEWMKMFDMVVNNTTILEFEQTCKKNKIKNCEIRQYAL
jgi:broad specificity phosphatase PhoE